MSKEQNENGVLTKKDLRGAGLRFIATSISTFNYPTQFAPSVVYSLSKCLRKIYKDDDEYVESLNNHFKYFNCMPWLAKIILGATLAMEDKEGLKAKDAVHELKISLMGPLSGIGDTIGWIMIPTIFGSIAAYMALEGSAVGLIIWVLLNLLIFPVRIGLVEFGYKQGLKIVTKFGEQMNVFTEATSVLGIVVIGSLISSVVKMKTGLTFSSGDVALEVQPLLDGIMPAMLPVTFTAFIYWLMKYKKVKMTYVILMVIVFSMFAAATGILV